MVTAASSADAAVVLVDATKLQWQDPKLQLLSQTRRHSLLVNLLRVSFHRVCGQKARCGGRPNFAFDNISAALDAFTSAARIPVHAVVPISALRPQRSRSRTRLVRLPWPFAAAIAGTACGRSRRTANRLLSRSNGSRSSLRPSDTSRAAVFLGPGGNRIIEPGPAGQVLPSGQTAT